jgi:hypothetical protein
MGNFQPAIIVAAVFIAFGFGWLGFRWGYARRSAQVSDEVGKLALRASRPGIFNEQDRGYLRALGEINEFVARGNI